MPVFSRHRRGSARTRNWRPGCTTIHAVNETDETRCRREMNRRNALGTSWRNRKKKLVHGQSVYIFILLVVFMGGQRSASGQVAESGEKQHPTLWAGGGASLYYVQYGEQKLVGATGFVDADSANGIGVEGEGRWLEFHEFAQVHAETYLVGPRYHIDINRFQPYIKGMVGAGDFNFPYNYAQGDLPDCGRRRRGRLSPQPPLERAACRRGISKLAAVHLWNDDFRRPHLRGPLPHFLKLKARVLLHTPGCTALARQQISDLQELTLSALSICFVKNRGDCQIAAKSRPAIVAKSL